MKTSPLKTSVKKIINEDEDMPDEDEDKNKPTIEKIP
jgi:hypothetical protein